MLKTLVAAGALLAAVMPAQASMQTYSQTGSWVSTQGTNDVGYPMCGLTTGGSFGGTYEALMLKYDLHYPDNLVIQFGKGSWNIPKTAKVKVVFQVDNSPTRYFWAYQGGRNDVLEVDMHASGQDPQTGESPVKLWLSLLREGRVFRISFPDGNEQPWVADLTGSAAELTNFGTCIKTVLTAAGKTQPFSNGNSGGESTQPFNGGGTTQRTQPYTPL